jgi:hypothetical protein
MVALVLCLAMPALAQTIPVGYHEQLRVELTNQAGAEVRASRDGGRSWIVLGHVLSAARKVNPQGFRAAMWVADSCVAATAVNAVHLKVATNPATGRAITLSLAPHGELEGDVQPQAAIVLDTKPGEGVFGGLGPTVGSPVCLWQAGQWQAFPADYQPRDGDRLLILRLVPERQLRYVDFENVFGGKITATYQDGGQEVLGHVLTPVTGIGRFDGTKYADHGRLRANHPGVLDVSTSPYGMVGGFQIIPWEHANDPEMDYVRTNRQWMVVGPNDLSRGWDGQAPLFWGNLYPSWRADDFDQADACDRLLSRVLVLCQRRGKTAGDEWEELPRIAFSGTAPVKSPRPAGDRLWLIYEPPSGYAPLPPAASSALADVVAIRFSLPMEMFWPGDE